MPPLEPDELLAPELDELELLPDAPPEEELEVDPELELLVDPEEPDELLAPDELEVLDDEVPPQVPVNRQSGSLPSCPSLPSTGSSSWGSSSIPPLDEPEELEVLDDAPLPRTGLSTQRPSCNRIVTVLSFKRMVKTVSAGKINSW